MVDTTVRACVICGETYRVAKARGGVRKTCSDECGKVRRRRANYATARHCSYCSREYRAKASQKFCSHTCQYEAQVVHGTMRRSAPRKSEFRKRAERIARTAAEGTSGGGTVWVQGPCIVCGTDFLSAGAASRYCSQECRKRNRNRAFGLSLLDRMALFERDDWHCQLCLRPVDYLSDPLSNYYPSLDHIVPRSKGGTDSPENLQLAHRICNSVRRDRPIWEVRHPSFLAAVS